MISAEFVEGSDSIVALTHSEGQHSNLRLRGSKLQKCYVYAVVKMSVSNKVKLHTAERKTAIN